MLKNKIRIGDLLVQHGIIAQEQLELAILEQKKTGNKLGNVLIEKKIVDEKKLLMTLASQLKIEFIDLNHYPCQSRCIKKLPEVYARRFQAILLNEAAGNYLVGMVDPQDILAVDEIKRILKKEFQLALVSEKGLSKAFDRHYDKNVEINRFAEELSSELLTNDLLVEDLNNLSKEDVPVVKLLRSLFEEALRMNASDIHIEPEQDHLLIRLRVDGVLQEKIINERRIVSALIQRLKLMGGLNIAEKRLPQDGRFNLAINKQSFDVRLATIPVQWGESVVMRLLRQTHDSNMLDDLDMPTDLIGPIRALMRRSHGMFLVTGPTGSGKTTTLYSMLHELNSSEKKIITIEDPVEYQLPRLCQIQINTKVDLSFSRVLRSVLRHDPDIVMIGELRDQESVEIALRAALTGHLVLGTLHTNDARSSAIRLIDMGVPGYLVASAIRGILSQRLIRTICLHCQNDYKPTEQEQVWLERITANSSDHPLKQGTGCEHCNYTGYLGRRGLFELLVLNTAMLDALRDGAINAFHQAVDADKLLKTLQANALDLLLAGKTTISEMIRVTGH